MLSTKKKKFYFKATPSSSMAWKTFRGDYFATSRILCGSISELGGYTDVSSNTSTAAAVAAIAYSKCLPVQSWTESSLNAITSHGLELAKLMDENTFMDVSSLMGTRNFPDFNKTVTLKESSRRNGTTDSSNGKFNLLPSASSIMEDFSRKRNSYCCIINGTSAAVILEPSNMYLFITNGLDEFGVRLSFRRPCVIEIDDLVDAEAIERLLSSLYAPKLEAKPSTAMNYLYSFVGMTGEAEEMKSK